MPWDNVWLLATAPSLVRRLPVCVLFALRLEVTKQGSATPARTRLAFRSCNAEAKDSLSLQLVCQ